MGRVFEFSYIFFSPNKNYVTYQTTNACDNYIYFRRTMINCLIDEAIIA